MDARDPVSLLGRIGGEVREGFVGNRRVLSFADFFALFVARPRRFARSAAQYLKDAFDHYGSEEVRTPRGGRRRFRLFDVPFDDGRDRLVGQEEVQGKVYRAIANFAREGRANRLILLHGPNGSAKSTFVSCLLRALEHYSTLDEGALYRFQWVFPSQKLQKSGIGFGGAAAGGEAGDSYAYLDEDMIDARLGDDLRDNPLLLLPSRARQELIPASADFRPSDYLLYGDLSPRNKQVFEALLASYKGDYLKVLRHVQVERFYVSRRYRQAAVTVEPQLAVDAHARQITMDASLSALPPALQALSMFQYSGDLVDANRGMIEYSDLLKRPLESYKYLLGTVEQSSVSVDGNILHLDAVFIGSSNEAHLDAFKRIVEFQSFKGRLELVPVPYLVDYRVEARIYDGQLRPEAVGKHIAPHVVEVAAQWAVLTRLRRPVAESYPEALGRLAGRLEPVEKADLYALGRAPAGLAPEQARELLASLEKVAGETEAQPDYEGRGGASPREIRTLILNAAQRRDHECVTPMAVLDEIGELIKDVTVYEFLQREPDGGYHRHERFVEVVRERYLDVVDEELRSSLGLVEEQQYAELFARYVAQVTQWVKQEKIRNPITGRLEDPDVDLMTEVEGRFGVDGARAGQEFRRDAIARIGAWSIDHPGEKLDYAAVFSRELGRMRDAYFEQRRQLVRRTAEDALTRLTGGDLAAADREARERVETTLRNLEGRFGYCPRCAREILSLLVQRRY